MTAGVGGALPISPHSQLGLRLQAEVRLQNLITLIEELEGILNSSEAVVTLAGVQSLALLDAALGETVHAAAQAAGLVAVG